MAKHTYGMNEHAAVRKALSNMGHCLKPLGYVSQWSIVGFSSPVPSASNGLWEPNSCGP